MERRRRSVRLSDYDYGEPGDYFVTICTFQRRLLFGRVVDGEMRLNRLGRIVEGEWIATGAIRREILIDRYVVMPNHIHALLTIDSTDGDRRRPVGAHGRAPLRRALGSLGALVAGFKAAATKKINAMRGTPGASVWQRNYYEHIVRKERDLERIRDYIESNPHTWASDEYNPAIRAEAHLQGRA